MDDLKARKERLPLWISVRHFLMQWSPPDPHWGWHRTCRPNSWLQNWMPFFCWLLWMNTAVRMGFQQSNDCFSFKKKKKTAIVNEDNSKRRTWDRSLAENKQQMCSWQSIKCLQIFLPTSSRTKDKQRLTTQSWLASAASDVIQVSQATIGGDEGFGESHLLMNNFASLLYSTDYLSYEYTKMHK